MKESYNCRDVIRKYLIILGYYMKVGPKNFKVRDQKCEWCCLNTKLLDFFFKGIKNCMYPKNKSLKTVENIYVYVKKIYIYFD